jgi:hypothetical protein
MNAKTVTEVPAGNMGAAEQCTVGDAAGPGDGGEGAQGRFAGRHLASCPSLAWRTKNDPPGSRTHMAMARWLT